MELVDVADSKSADGDIMWVRVPPPAPKSTVPLAGAVLFCCVTRMRTHRVRSVRPQEGKRQRSLIGTVERMPLCGSPTAGTKQKEQLVLLFFVAKVGENPHRVRCAPAGAIPRPTDACGGSWAEVSHRRHQKAQYPLRVLCFFAV